MLAVTAPEPSVRSVPEQVKVAAVALPPWVHGTEQDLTASCRPLTGSVVRTLGVATVVWRATVASAEEPAVTRWTARGSGGAVVDQVDLPGERVARHETGRGHRDREALLGHVDREGARLDRRVHRRAAVGEGAEGAHAGHRGGRAEDAEGADDLASGGALREGADAGGAHDCGSPMCPARRPGVRRQGRLWSSIRRSPASVPQGIRKMKGPAASHDSCKDPGLPTPRRLGAVPWPEPGPSSGASLERTRRSSGQW